MLSILYIKKINPEITQADALAKDDKSRSYLVNTVLMIVALVSLHTFLPLSV